MKKYFILLVFVMSPAQAVDHSAWDELLEQHVTWVKDGTTTVVDYRGFSSDRRALKEYLSRLSSVRKPEYEDFSRNERLAFLINAYNAFTIELILRHYPAIDSIKEIGNHFKQPWDIKFFRLLGEERMLNQLEHKMIRVWFDEPLIHFVVNCASVGCPALRPEALTGDRLEEQMKDSAKRFLRDDSRNRFDAEAGVLRVSPIFDWYADDFQPDGGVQDFLAGYAQQLGTNKRERSRIRKGDYSLDYLRYDWDLNVRKNIVDDSTPE
jgi:hypothetical protein